MNVCDAFELAFRCVSGFFAEFAQRCLLGAFAGIDHAGRKLEHNLADAVLVLPNEYDVLFRRDCKYHDEAACFSHVVVFDDRSARKLDPIAAHPQVRRVDNDLGFEDLPVRHDMLRDYAKCTRTSCEER